MLQPHRLRRKSSRSISECNPLQIPRLDSLSKTGTHAAQSGQLQRSPKALRQISGVRPPQHLSSKRHSRLPSCPSMEERAHALHHQETASPGQPPQRLLASPLRRRVGSALLHQHSPDSLRQRPQRHHRHQDGRHLLLQERRQRQMEPARSSRRRAKLRIRRRSLRLQPRRSHHVLHTLHLRPRLSAPGADYDQQAQRRHMEQARRVRHSR